MLIYKAFLQFLNPTNFQYFNHPFIFKLFVHKTFLKEVYSLQTIPNPGFSRNISLKKKKKETFIFHLNS